MADNVSGDYRLISVIQISYANLIKIGDTSCVGAIIFITSIIVGIFLIFVMLICIHKMICRLHRYLVKRWILTRMAAHEFYFKRPFDIEAEFPIMMVLQILAFIPLETIGIFAYVRWFGSIRGYTLLILAVSIGINYLIAKWLIARIKATPLAENTIAEYEQMSQGARKHLYSFMPVAEVVFCTSIMPWLLLGIAVFVICVVFPH